MKAHPNPGASGLGGAPQDLWGTSNWDAVRDAWSNALRPAVLEPAQAAMAVMSRCTNHALSQQVEHAYAAAERARDCAKAAAALAARECPPGPAREAMVAVLASQAAAAERGMRDVLRFGREHGHLAFAFPVCG
jgi:hypothetical protein